MGDTSRIAVYTYDKDVIQQTSFEDNFNRQQIEGLLDVNRIPHDSRGKTHMYEAVTTARDYLTASSRRVSGQITATQAVILFTDGTPAPDDFAAHPFETTENVLNVLKSLMDAEIHVIMIGKDSSCFAITTVYRKICFYSVYGKWQNLHAATLHC